MRLIINADDFGRTRGINYGIVESMKNGVLTSTTIMMTMPYAEHAVDLAKKEGLEGIGVHLTFIERSLSNKKSLVDENGIFKEYSVLMKEAEAEDIKAEMRMQIDSLINLGINPTHLDSHHHTHLYCSKMVNVIFDIAKEYKLPIRLGKKNNWKTRMNEEVVIPKNLVTTELFIHEYYNEKVSLDNFLNFINSALEYDTVELMCHPAFLCNDTLKSSYNYPRLTELDVLTNTSLKKFITEKNIELINYSNL